ncbi:MAG: endonuclease domain-containing protein [Patescibacteria group bacterium]
MDRQFIHSNKSLKERRRELRKNQTIQEKALWKYLRKEFLNARFQRQHSIGTYIVDFYCAKKRLIIEIDGAGHTESDAKLYDKDRTKYFEDQGMNVIRFWNYEIDTNIEKVISIIQKYI